MPTVKKKVDPKVTALKTISKVINEIKVRFDSLETKDQLRCLEELGVGSQFYTCQYCNKVKKKSDFYVSTAPGQASGITSACKQCAADVAMPTVDGVRKQPDKKSVDNACYLLNKPMLDSVWDASILEAANEATGKTKNNVWTSYIKNIQMVNWATYTYRESDNYTGGMLSLDDMTSDAMPKDQEIIEQFEKNKDDTLRLLGYLPFEKEKLSDQPFLYSQLIGFLDSSEEGNDDMMRVSSIISIVRSFLQLKNIDDMIASLSSDPRNAEKNISTIRALQQMKNQITQGATKLAEQSCISLKNSKNSIKGENTWSGKIKKIKDMNLRAAEVNGFDIATCRGMKQVQEISDASIMKQLALDESEWSDMVASMRVDNQTLRRERDQYKEINRILLRENLDLKDYLEENGIIPEEGYIDLKDIYSPFGEDKEEIIEEELIENE